MEIICKICNPTLQGNGYCAEHSTGGSSYFDNYGEHNIKRGKKSMEKETKKCLWCELCNLDTYLYDELDDYQKGMKDILNIVFENEKVKDLEHTKINGKNYEEN